MIDGQSVPPRTVVARMPQALFELNERLYRGALILSMGADGDLIATEELPVEDYVRGVVPSEVPALWPRQAVMAQAVAARTFALHRALSTTGRSWISRLDLAYRGVDGESWRSDRAVRDTLGTVLEWNGRPLPAFFHSTCGGHTTSAQNVFGGLDIPPLAGVPCRWDEDSPHYAWKTSILLSDLAERLKARGVSTIQSIREGERDPSGRLKHVVVNGQKRIPAAYFRMEVDARTIKSTDFSITRNGDTVEFSGHGWGHGVGLCQWGAHGMAEAGHSWREILSHYYPGANLRQVHELQQMR
jgi:stage II sporulation protein D